MDPPVPVGATAVKKEDRVVDAGPSGASTGAASGEKAVKAMVVDGAEVIYIDSDDNSSAPQNPQATEAPENAADSSVPARSNPVSVAQKKAPGSSSDEDPDKKPLVYKSGLGDLLLADARLVNRYNAFLEPDRTRVAVSSYVELVVEKHAGVQQFIDIEEIVAYSIKYVDNFSWYLRKSIRPRLPYLMRRSILNASFKGETIFERDEQRGGPSMPHAHYRLRSDYQVEGTFVGKTSEVFVNRRTTPLKGSRKQPPRKRAKIERGGPSLSSTRAEIHDSENDNSSDGADSEEESEESDLKSQADDAAEPEVKPALAPPAPAPAIHPPQPAPETTPKNTADGPSSDFMTVKIGGRWITARKEDIRDLIDM